MDKWKLLRGLAALFAISACGQDIQAYASGSQEWSNDCCYMEQDGCWEDRFNINAEFLYWSVNNTLPSNFSITESISETTFLPGIIETDTVVGIDIDHHKTRWAPGVRVGLGWEGERWGIRAVYTGVWDSHTRTYTDPALPGFIPPTTTIHRRVNYNVADLEIGREFFPDCGVIVRPFIGVRGLWLNQHHYSSLTSLDIIPTISGGVGSFIIDEPLLAGVRNRHWGVGPRIGVDTTWGWDCGLSFLGNVSASMLYGNPRSEYLLGFASVDEFDGVFEVDTLTATITERNWRLTPNVQMFIGVGYETNFNFGGSNLNIYAGWEANYYWEASNILIFQRGIGLQGLTTGVAFSF